MPRQKVRHAWPKSYQAAVEIQERLRPLLKTSDETGHIKTIAGADVSYSKGSDTYFAAVVVMSYPDMAVVEEAWAMGPGKFPYIPGLLSFREGPICLKAFSKLKTAPDVVMFDGQGIAHPRGFGLASHMGVLLDIPSIGCAKSVLVGEYKEPGAKRGSSTPLIYKGAEVGRAFRTRDGVKPVFVSAGHKVSLKKACELALKCAKGYRIPEPTRRAHILVNRIRKEQEQGQGQGPSFSFVKEKDQKKHYLSTKATTSVKAKAKSKLKDLMGVYETLYKHYGPQHWWPGDTEFEMMVGAILTQNTNWGNVERAIANLKAANALDPHALHDMPEAELAQLIRPSGYFNIKAKRLKAYIEYFVERYGGSAGKMKRTPCEELRDEILSVRGVGPETADSILLYALGCPIFVVDAYTKRIFSRHGFFPEDSDYHHVQKYFMDRLPKDARLYNEYHALIVRLAKDRCMKKAGRCGICLLTGNE